MPNLPFALRVATSANFPAGANPWSGLPTRIFPSNAWGLYGWTPDEPPPAQYQNYLQGNLAESHNIHLSRLCSRAYPGAPDALTPGTAIVWDPARYRWLTCRKVSGTVMAAGVRGADGRSIVSVNTTLTATGAPQVGIYVGGGSTKFAIFATDASTEVLVINCQTLAMTKETLPGVARGANGPSMATDAAGNTYVAGAGVVYKRAVGGTVWLATTTPTGFVVGDVNIALTFNAAGNTLYAFNRDNSTPRTANTVNGGTSWTAGTPTGLGANVGFTLVYQSDVVLNPSGSFYFVQTWEDSTTGNAAAFDCTSTDCATWSRVNSTSSTGVGFRQVAFLNGVQYAIGYRKDANATLGVHSELFVYRGSLGSLDGWESTGVMLSPTNAVCTLNVGGVNLAIGAADAGGTPLFTEPQFPTRVNW